ncbi:MAG TPA: GGDEF domain-containing protein, partial [Gammaproteobacteria bacterium]|nr:GGDEF domain-containing protein [Gammaproteobacteria bacterium]
GTLWLMLLLTGIALWAQSAQLHMLLGLYRQATRDGLTGLFNRRALFRQLDREMARSRRHGSPLAMLLVDLDRFKRINDHYGHPVGDEALRQMAGVLVGQCRTEDLLGRYGGEEFMVVAANTDGDGASRMAERIRAGIEARTLATAKGELSLTASIGVTGWQPGETLDLLVARADAALLQAKEAGRNRVVRLEELPEDHLPLVQPEQP